MQLSKYVLCEDGFANFTDDGKVSGFAVRMRIPYYRGVPLSLVDDVLVVVDSVHYTGDDILFRVHGGTFTLDEMKTVVRHRWNYGEKATVLVKKEGGLKPGKHHVEAYAKIRVCYMPAVDFAGGYADMILE